jgi:adenine deaminase
LRIAPSPAVDGHGPGLSVLPELRITDKGLFDVTKFALTDIAAT